MGELALIDCFAYVAGHDFTTDSNKLQLHTDAEGKTKTTFGSGGWAELQGALKMGKLDLAGYWQSAASDSVDSDAFGDLGLANKVVTFGDIETEGEVAYLGQLGQFHYELGGAIGEIAPFVLTCDNSDGVGIVRGLLAKAKGSVAATGQLGSIVNLGAPIAGQYVYAALHVFSAGTTITVQVQSDDAAGFASPTTRGTIGPITVPGGTWLTRVAGPFVGETHWRLNVSAITAAFSVAGAIAVQ